MSSRSATTGLVIANCEDTLEVGSGRQIIQYVTCMGISTDMYM